MSKNKTEIFRGGATALITPMRDGKIDYAALEHLIDFQVQNGIDSLVVAGTSGEVSTLSERERRECIRFTIDKTGHRVPVIVGTGSNDTSRAVAFSKDAEKRGADALLVVTPYYNRSSDDGLIEH